MTYRVGIGHNIALVSLTVLSPQPRSDGVKFTRQDFAGDGTVIQQGLYVEFVWGIIRNTAAYHEALSTTSILARFGLDDDTSADVTIYARDNRLAWKRYNGKAILPEPGAQLDYRSFPRNIHILIRGLVALA